MKQATSVADQFRVNDRVKWAIPHQMPVVNRPTNQIAALVISDDVLYRVAFI